MLTIQVLVRCIPSNERNFPNISKNLLVPAFCAVLMSANIHKTE